MTQNALSEAAKTWERSHLEHIMNILKVSVDLIIKLVVRSP